MSTTLDEEDIAQGFIFEDLDIRGTIVRLGPVWRAIQGKRSYDPIVGHVLGEMAAIACIISANLKQPGRLTFQLSGNGPISLLVMDCSARLNLRGYAQASADIRTTELPSLFGDAQLMLTLDIESMRQPYQSYVPVQGSSVAEAFSHFLEQSEQQPSLLRLAADGQHAAGLFIQKLPGADGRDADGWARIQHLAATLKTDELTRLAPREVLLRLFSEETVRVFEPRPITHHFPKDWAKIHSILRSLGREEVESIVREQGKIVIHDDLSDHEYSFTATDIDAIFRDEPPTSKTLH